MIQEIKYNGFTANPSDYECPDGDLAMSVGLVPEDGALKPVLPPKVLFSLGENQKVVFIHQTSAFKYYIVLDTSNYKTYYTNGTTSGTSSSPKLSSLYSFPTDVEIYSFNAVGNTLIALTSTGMHYLLWKNQTEGYIYLGTHFPECPISFGLQGEMVRSDDFTFTFTIGSADEQGNIYYGELSDSNKTLMTNLVLAKVNKFIADNSTNAGKFLYPFLVRYAYRLYDGSLLMHSAPVLMVCTSGLAPLGYITSTSAESGENGGLSTTTTMHIFGMFHDLDYAVVQPTALTQLKLWNDIIKSVDIFVSAPIYTYDQSGECTQLAANSRYITYSVCKNVGQKASTSVYPIRYQVSTSDLLYALTFNPDEMNVPSVMVMIPERDDESIRNDITNNSLFYLLRSINVGDLKTSRTIIPVKDDYLQSLQTREVMTDDYDSHDLLIPKYSYNYNSRLNLANLRKRLFQGFHAASMFTYTNGYVDTSGTENDGETAVRVWYYIRQEGKEIVTCGESGTFGYGMRFLWIFYPNTNAYKARLECNAYYYEVDLEPHQTLNGAFYFGSWNGIIEDGTLKTVIPTLSSDSERTIDVPNKIYTSEVNNPFYFPVLGINTIGTGTILGIISAAKALSQGQFGQFPLYAFSTDGVWALEVSSTGTYSAKQPITRDVCINPDSITQIDSAVLFATDRGIMLISGSETVCLSESINSRDLFSLSDLPAADKLVSVFNQFADEQERITLENSSLLPFREFLVGCRMIYDYTGQRILVYNPSVSYAYVYSLKSKTWGMIHSEITDNVNAYPDALAMVSGNKLVNFSTSDAEGITALIVTRPFKLGQPDVFKTIDTVIQRGYFRSGHVCQVLYGSRNLFDWHILWSSTDKYLRGFRGSPYKYFRLALICKFDKAESAYGCSVQFTPRFTNKPR